MGGGGTRCSALACEEGPRSARGRRAHENRGPLTTVHFWNSVLNTGRGCSVPWRGFRPVLLVRGKLASHTRVQQQGRLVRETERELLPAVCASGETEVRDRTLRTALL